MLALIAHCPWLYMDHCMETASFGIQHQFQPLLGYQSDRVS